MARLFNNPGSEVVDACEAVEQEFKALWRQHGLVETSAPSVPAPVAQTDEEEEEEEELSESEDEGSEESEEEEEEESESEESEEPAPKPKKRKKDKKKRPRQPTLPMCLKLLKLLMKIPEADPFLAPVDAEELGLDDYHERVLNPMDLGTILENLQGGKIVGWANIKYKTPLDFRKDVELVWGNCRLYNDQPEDEWIRELCAKCEETFVELWREHKFEEFYNFVEEETSEEEPEETPRSKAKKKNNKKKKPRKSKKLSAGAGKEPSTPEKRKREDIDYFPDLESDFAMTPTPKPKQKKVKKILSTPKSQPKRLEDLPNFVPLTEDQVKEAFDLKPGGRCPVCKVQKKGSCGTETSPLRCYRRQFNGLPFTALTYEDMHKFANMVSNRAKNKGSRGPKRTKEEVLRQKLVGQVQRRQAEARKAEERASSAQAEVLDLEEVVRTMERREREIEEMETRMNRERQERATLVEAAEYCRPVISIPDKIMDLGNYFFQIKG